jgi:hypothetical protein
MLDPIKTAPPKRFNVFTTIQILEAAYACLQAEFGELPERTLHFTWDAAPNRTRSKP